MDKRDIALHRSCPAICTPRFTDLAPAEECGERVLIASNGTFLEVTRKWGRFVRKIGEVSVKLPYGEVQPSTTLVVPELPRHLLERFDELAKEHSDIEIGASILWNEITNEFRLAPVKSLEASSGHLKYQLTDMNEGDHLVVDCHSHSKYHPAFFSKVDDQDDAYAVKYAYVVGDCGRDTPSRKLRRCIKGIFEEVPLK